MSEFSGLRRLIAWLSPFRREKTFVFLENRAVPRFINSAHPFLLELNRSGFALTCQNGNLAAQPRIFKANKSLVESIIPLLVQRTVQAYFFSLTAFTEIAYLGRSICQRREILFEESVFLTWSSKAFSKLAGLWF